MKPCQKAIEIDPSASVVTNNPNDLDRELHIRKNLQWITEWLNNGKSDRSIATYTYSIKQFLEFLASRNIWSLEQVTPAILLSWQEYLKSKNYKQTTINNKIVTAKSLYNYITNAGYIIKNPANIIKLKKTTSSINNKLPEWEEIQTLLEAAENERDRLIIELFYKTGLRVSELCAIKKEDFRGNRLTILGKGSKLRTLLLPQALVKKLMALFKTPEQVYLFASRKGRGTKPMGRQTIHDILKKIIKKANVNPAISCHWLRHFHAVESLDRGAPLHLVQKALGHSNLGTTGVYLNARPNESTSLYFDD